MKKNKMDTQEYQFIKETVKKQPKENGSLLRRLLMIAGCGVLFGGCAAVTFASVFPVMADREENTWREAIIKDFGEKIELPVPSKAGYTFDGWYVMDDEYNRAHFTGTQFSIGSKFDYHTMPDLSVGKEQDGTQIFLEPRFTPIRETAGNAPERKDSFLSVSDIADNLINCVNYKRANL